MALPEWFGGAGCRPESAHACEKSGVSKQKVKCYERIQIQLSALRPASAMRRAVFWAADSMSQLQSPHPHPGRAGQDNPISAGVRHDLGNVCSSRPVTVAETIHLGFKTKSRRTRQSVAGFNAAIMPQNTLLPRKDRESLPARTHELRYLSCTDPF